MRHGGQAPCLFFDCSTNFLCKGGVIPKLRLSNCIAAPGQALFTPAASPARSYRYVMCTNGSSTLSRPLERCSASAHSVWAGAAAALRTPKQLPMKTPHSLLTHAARALALAVILASPTTMDAQQITTNWAAYHEHRPGPIIPPHVPTAASWGTTTNVTTFDMGAPGNAFGNLVNFYTGEQLPVTV